MKLLTRDTDYAIRALCYVALHQEGMVSVKELERKLRIPRPFLRKILQVLNRERVLRSYKGPGGGFRLNLSPKEIRITHLIKIFQGSLKLNECLFRMKVCPNVKTCVLKERIDKIERYVISRLGLITIATLAASGGRNRR